MRCALDPTGGHRVMAAPDAPTEGRCPSCGGVVMLRHRRSADGVTWFYRHKHGEAADDCALRATGLSVTRRR
jgi:hypothetical protein